MTSHPKRLAILTGAGMSTESGVPDFRSQSGLWAKHDPMQTATVEALEENYDHFHDFYSSRLDRLQTLKPHSGHDIITKWQKAGIVSVIATQNVDGLHQEAGSANVAELHGNLREFKCHDCRTHASQEDFISKNGCRRCGGKLRPNIVLFGEQLPMDTWEYAMERIRESDALLVVGTSLEVAPVNQLPDIATNEKIYINDDVDTDVHFTRVIQDEAGSGLKRLSREWEL
ncbi:SIR2 family NAD-dependent protein deacylase [Natribacillus halophilus]|uniref:protein acetyllysine N-acetyltransferase n=1 Tax=Natribacillus halophilus TaxID=549003 RepID=A0A1G8JE60_9BACI|nr:Sir2 family NAD-dependent protein deacetylase [Natribacillus halophilus]SDI29584.1 NAD-dependent deacetylase [Natribacillus halophilus]